MSTPYLKIIENKKESQIDIMAQTLLVSNRRANVMAYGLQGKNHAKP